MKNTGIVMLMLAALLTTATLSQAGWFKDAGQKAGRLTRQTVDRSKKTYSHAKDYSNSHKDEWRRTTKTTYKKSKKAARDARDGFRQGYNRRRR